MVIKLTLCLLIGILLGHAIKFPLSFVFLIEGLLLTTLCLLLIFKKRQYFKNIWFGILVFISFVALGALTTALHDATNNRSHYTSLAKNLTDSNVEITFRIRAVLKSSYYHHKYIIDILNIDKHYVVGKSILYIQKEANDSLLQVDDTFFTRTSLEEIPAPLNPHQFNYKKYLERNHIYHQLSLKHTDLLPASKHKHTLFGYAHFIRTQITKNLSKFAIQADELSIINALLLGQRQDISPEVYRNYTQAGAVHILAVSGLHVGILLLLLNIVLRPFELLKNGNVIKTVILVILLWLFALIAGLSASVVRAVFMFTIFAIAMNLKRPTNSYNTAAISMFFLLLMKPNFIFDVGFQLSYVAVIAILTFQPILDKLWKPKWKIVTYFWNILTVTIAAQIGILPLSLFYFHQFPGLFFLSNLVIIPFLGLILGMGLIVILLASINLLPEIIAVFYGNIIKLMNSFVEWIASKDSFLIKEIHFNIDHVLFCYLLLMLLLKLYYLRNYSALKNLLIGVFIFQCSFILTPSKSSNSFTIFHRSRQSIFGLKSDKHLTLYSQNMDSLLLDEKWISSYKVRAQIDAVSLDTISWVYQFNGTKLLIVDSLGLYDVTFKPDIIILRNSPQINLNRLLAKLQPKLVISDGSNYVSFQNRWKKTCNQKKVPFHQTSKKGAFIYNF